VLGVALVSSAFILYPRVHEMAVVWELPEYLVLGRTMAHELGHLLLGANSHSSNGLMRPQFNSRDLSLESGQFLFDAKQARRLRESLRSAGAHKNPTVAILLDYTAHLPAPILTRTQVVAANVFRQAGIEVRWITCSFRGS
jgi:hypothetical protein